MSAVVAAAALAGGASATPFGESPFKVSAQFSATPTNVIVDIGFDIPAKHRIYSNSLVVTGLHGSVVTPIVVPEPIMKTDPQTGGNEKFHAEAFTARYAIVPPAKTTAAISVSFQGCDDVQCFFPETLEFSADGMSDGPAPDGRPAPATGVLPDDFAVSRRVVGYQGEKPFHDFLEGRYKGESLLSKGWIVGLLLILGGGLLLNLTPCVLPMIPINLAILGAGAQAQSKLRGFLLGATYGFGMALAYGALGVIVVLTGAPFGALNASPWFNAAIAVLFVVLALAMFGMINIDLSGMQARMGGGSATRNRFVAAFSLGIVAALLAGACVAPVLIGVLLLATSLYQQGHAAGLLLPFLLGLGMALPWPLAGAGLSFLPKPGGWMDKVKYGFGVVILVMAAHYGWLAWKGFAPPEQADADDPLSAVALGPESGAEDWAAVFESARREGKPVLIDFWATWCKNCLAMDATTLRQPSVRSALEQFVVVKYQAEAPGRPPAKPILDEFGVMGLPTFVIVERYAASEAR